MSWFDTDGDGHVATIELDNIKLFHRAPQRTQNLLREFHDKHVENSVLYSLTKSDFTMLVKMPEEEQIRLLTKLQSRLAPTIKRRALGSSSSQKKKNNKKVDQKKNGKKTKPTSKRDVAAAAAAAKGTKTKQQRQQRGRRPPRAVKKDKKEPPVMSTLFRKSNKSQSRSPNPAKAGQQSSSNISLDDEEDWNVTTIHVERMDDHLNCAVPRSMRSQLSMSGVQLANKKNGGGMFQKLRATKAVYNRMWDNAHSREDSLNCGSFADLTLPGSDRAHRLARLQQKHAGWG